MSAVFNRIGAYEILDEIGRGGMAQVFLAKDTRTDRTVALKVVPPGRDHDSREVLAAERAGAELQRQFSQVSPHVPKVYDHGEDESGYFLVAMEYLDGENLSDVIARGETQAERAVNVAVDLCACLELAHRFEPTDGTRPIRLVHGDLKPRNVRITSDGSVKVLDFGIAKALSLSRKVTRNDFGTMPYLSPERLDAGEVDEFADLWAVGVMLYEMVRGLRPYEAADTQRLERLIRARVPPVPLTGHCPLGLEAVIARLLGPTPSVRYESARAAREDLERFKSGQITKAEELGWPSPDIRRGGPVEPADPDATRRTRPVDEPTGASPAVAAAPGIADPDATRRTQPGATNRRQPTPSAVSAATIPPAPAARAATPARRRRPDQAVARLLFIAFIVGGVGLTANECDVASDARRLSANVSTRELDQLTPAFDAHDRLAERSHLNWGTWALERALTQRTLTLTDRVIGNYRMGLPTVREAQWQTARDMLARAIPVSGGDRRVRAAFRYCDGHLHRINGEAHKKREEDEEAQRELTEAIASFREAADLRPDWPDPFLGLARTFIYGLEDIDRGADAMNQAQQRGYMPTERETAQLADGYRARGNTLVRSAKELAGMSQESDYLTRAIEAYSRALMLYTQSTSVPNVTTSIRQTQRALDQAQRHLDEVSSSPPDEPAESEPDAAQPGTTEDSATPSEPPAARPTRSVYREERAPWR